MRLRFVVILFAIGALSFAGAWALQGAVPAQDDEKATEEKKAELGVTISDLSEMTAETLDIDSTEGAYVRFVQHGSAAHDAGLRSGDVIVAIDSVPIASADDLVEAIKNRKPGDAVEVSFIRKGVRQTLAVTLGERKHRDGRFALRVAPRVALMDKPHIRARTLAPTIAYVTGSHNYIGISYNELNEQLGDYFGVEKGKGILVTEVMDDSPAQKGGLMAGDVIVSAGGKSIEDGNDLNRIIRKHEGEEPLELIVIRRGERITIQVVPEERKGFKYKCGETIHGLERLKDLDIHMGELEHHLEELEHFELHAPDIDIHVPDFEFHVPEIINEPFIFNLESFGDELGMGFRLRIDEGGHVEFNDKSFDSIDEFKDYLDSEEFEKYKEEIGEKIRTRIKKNLDRIKVRTTSTITE